MDKVGPREGIPVAEILKPVTPTVPMGPHQVPEHVQKGCLAVSDIQEAIVTPSLFLFP